MDVAPPTTKHVHYDDDDVDDDKAAAQRVDYLADAPSERDLVISLSELAMQQDENKRKCVFCETVIDGRPFNPRPLIVAQDRNAKKSLFSASDMEADEKPESDDVFSGAMNFWMSTPMCVCSAPCWVAETLARRGEQSPLGKHMATMFPMLLPSHLGGVVLDKFRAREAQLRDELRERSAARVAMFQRPTIEY